MEDIGRCGIRILLAHVAKMLQKRKGVVLEFLQNAAKELGNLDRKNVNRFVELMNTTYALVPAGNMVQGEIFD